MPCRVLPPVPDIPTAAPCVGRRIDPIAQLARKQICLPRSSRIHSRAPASRRLQHSQRLLLIAAASASLLQAPTASEVPSCSESPLSLPQPPASSGTGSLLLYVGLLTLGWQHAARLATVVALLLVSRVSGSASRSVVPCFPFCNGRSCASPQTSTNAVCSHSVGCAQARTDTCIKA